MDPIALSLGVKLHGSFTCKTVPVVAGHAATGTVLQVKEPCNFTPKLNAMGSIDLGGHVLKGVSPLVQNAAHVRPKRLERNAPCRFKTIRRESDRRLWVGGDFIPAPPGGIYASFVQEARRKGAIPNCR